MKIGAVRMVVRERSLSLVRNRQHQPLASKFPFDLFCRADAPIWYSRNHAIYSEGDDAQYLYKVKSGCIRTLKVLGDGRRLIGSFYFPGDVFGFEYCEKYSLSAEAVTRCKLVAIKRKTANRLAANSNVISAQLLALTNLEMLRNQKHAFLLLKTAQERVVAFLLDVENLEPADGSIDLPMKRQDIADYLGLSIETVSRMLQRIEATSAISRPTIRCVKVCNREMLDRMN
jgi:CRP/FNR family nitrogen fixation transcriptional regulator